MKTRLVEVPVCDRCSQEGEIYVVSTLAGDGFTIVRCERHIERLQREADVTGVDVTGHEAVTEVHVDSREAALEALIIARPGLRPGEYGVELDMTPQAVGKVARALRAKGTVEVDGKTYIPA